MKKICEVVRDEKDDIENKVWLYGAMLMMLVNLRKEKYDYDQTYGEKHADVILKCVLSPSEHYKNHDWKQD